MPDVHQLIEDAFAGQRLTASEVQAIAEHIAAAGFDPRAYVLAGRRLAGIYWRGQRLTKQSRLSNAEAHYLRHVVAVEEWPMGTTLEEYLSSAARMTRAPLSGVFISRRNEGDTIGIIGQSGAAQGPDGYEWMLLEYQVTKQHWATVFQPRKGLDHLAFHAPRREMLRWLRQPS